MNWYIGQEIVCVNGHVNGLVKKDGLYTIRSLKESPCSCQKVLIDVGFNVPETLKVNGCVRHQMIHATTGQPYLFSENRFAPLDTLCNISELTEILETTKPFEV